MEVNPRMVIRNKAELEHQSALLEVIQKYDLTYGEIFSILSASIRNWAIYLKRDEQKTPKGIGKVMEELDQLYH